MPEEKLKVVTAADVINDIVSEDDAKAREASRRMQQAFRNVLLGGSSNGKERALVMTWFLTEGGVFALQEQFNASAYADMGKRNLVLDMLRYLGFGNDIVSLLKALQAIHAADKEFTTIVKEKTNA